MNFHSWDTHTRNLFNPLDQSINNNNKFNPLQASRLYIFWRRCRPNSCGTTTASSPGVTSWAPWRPGAAASSTTSSWTWTAAKPSTTRSSSWTCWASGSARALAHCRWSRPPYTAWIGRSSGSSLSCTACWASGDYTKWVSPSHPPQYPGITLGYYYYY